MSTANFQSMEYGMPLVVGGLLDFEEMARAYEEECGGEYTDALFWWDVNDEFRRAENLAEEFDKALTFHNITVIDGYYSGFQFYVEEKYNDYFELDGKSEYCIDNEDAHYYFDMNRSEALKAAAAEKRKISKWLESLENEGFDIIVCTGKFSSGEAIYAKKTQRTALLSAASA